MTVQTRRDAIRRSIVLVSLLILTIGVASAAVIWPMSAASAEPAPEVGEVAPQDFLAPYAHSYTSEVLTERQRESAIRNVIPRYTSADTSVARQQLERLRAALAFITSVRADAYASTEQKLADLAALEAIYLSQETATAILELNDLRWQAVNQEAIVVLETVMRSTIREDRLEDYRRTIPTLVSLSLPEEQVAIVAELVSAFVAPNSLYSEELTEAARQQAIEGVEPVIQSFAEGETIVERGEIISAEDVETLQELGLAQPEDRWQDRAGAIALIVLSISILIVYLRRHPELTNDLRGLTLVTILFLLFVSAARFLLPGHVVLPYLYPIPAFALIVAALYGDQIALTLTIPLVLLTTYSLPNTIELTLFYALSSLFGVLIPKQTQRITAYLWVGTTIAASGAITITAYRLISSDVDWLGMATLAGAAVVNGIVSAGLAVLLQYFLAPLLGMTTPLQLIELSRPDHPLLEYLLRHAPGTYQHSLQVANLAEQAAESIDADSLLTRVGALYHDVGKTQNPQFFIENQIAGPLNPHDDLDPAESAAIIIRHVSDGIVLTQEHHLPRRIQDFVSEHHGTLQTRYQLTQALNAAGGDATTVDKTLFQYPGPRPQSRETALVMLADGCEARVRSQHPADEEELREIIRDTVNNRLITGQLDNTSLTLQDINTIIDSFTATLRGIYHPRVEYPTLNQTTQPNPRITLEAPEETEPTDPTESQSSP